MILLDLIVGIFQLIFALLDGLLKLVEWLIAHGYVLLGFVILILGLALLIFIKELLFGGGMNVFSTGRPSNLGKNEPEDETGDYFIDASGTLRGPNDRYIDASGTWRDPDDRYIDASGTWRDPDDRYIDYSGNWRKPRKRK